jgi:hypothetical protein
MYIRGLVLPPFCLSFLSSSRNVLYFYPIQPHLPLSLIPSPSPSVQPSQAPPCPRPALPSLPSQVPALALPRVPWTLISSPGRPLQDHKDILSTEDLPEDWGNYVTLIKKRDMQHCT